MAFMTLHCTVLCGIPSALPLFFQGCWDALLIAINATLMIILCAVSYKSVIAHIKFKVGTGWHSKSIVVPDFGLYCTKYMQYTANRCKPYHPLAHLRSLPSFPVYFLPQAKTPYPLLPSSCMLIFSLQKVNIYYTVQSYKMS